MLFLPIVAASSLSSPHLQNAGAQCAKSYKQFASCFGGLGCVIDKLSGDGWCLDPDYCVEDDGQCGGEQIMGVYPCCSEDYECLPGASFNRWCVPIE